MLIKKIVLFSFLVLLDQIVKYIIRFSGGFYICNIGIAFGLKIPDFLFWIFWVLGILIFLYFLFFKKEKNLIEEKSINNLYLILIFSGAFSNIVDRIIFGCVVDFIDFKIWPVFNFADVFIFLGTIGFVINILSNKSKKVL